MNRALAARLAELVHTASGGTLDAGLVMNSREPLTALGLTSLGRLRLVDVVEEEFDVVLDLDEAHLDDFPSLVRHVSRHTTEDES
ncbi:acyl carrier protein [Thermocatellispora tengchongensis]|uniref:Acyl carrier protein n=1 Tax=Thermocatellispora tengchongensis TaxID=1073253 RepID=A0A840PBW5_9ACTN|nr:phosphopantetheine-binding protein [Thermocatellispora tengchongensis]MBB5136742.1 acyl carrier protein [Thermocatellispora tengchongensis]